MHKEENGEIDPDFINRLAGFLGFEEERVRHLFEKKYLARNWGKHEHMLRFDKEISHIEHGTVLYEKGSSFEIIMGFPKIRRAMVLDPTLKKHFNGLSKLTVEEKMNGYNVRVAQVDGEILAITRSGYICPYTTERANAKLNLEFFDAFPELVLYGEMVGPDNPYVPKTIYDVESVEFFIFDIREKNTGKPLPTAKRRETMEKYGFFQVRSFGEIPLETAPEEIANIIRELGKTEHEGVVIKDPEMVLPSLKYTSSQSNCSDLRHAFKFYNEAGRDYMLSRIVREGFQTVEWDEDETEFKKRCIQLGESILNPLRESIRSVKDGERLYEEVRIRVRDLKTATEFENYLKRLGVDTIFEAPQPAGNEYLVNIKKINKSTNDKTQAIWEGELW
ncbi:RNA ligase, family [Methanosarcina siciliae C2J]|uniref:RNA ligase, family n=3 Tax=Methanosarcina siciliae TaxID=38027 RepID=A0A0E3P9M9_9EURY|nr:RNA ligase [Methanosarcina siciliae]AKB26733.1 RNA ligase, family [Methanosarcina siciliae T4/M]AKB30704.1 RNA ligase, family [Methanosarcina siciliae HI350]AKB34606.1 RNA ligase, family [Methanosarcina siciliae C2J]